MATKQQPPITPEVPNDEIDLRGLFLAIWNGKWVVVGVTIIFIGIASFYTFSKPITYKSSIILSPPSEATVLEINKEGIFEESKDSLFRRFLEKFTAPEFQVEVLKDKGYLNQLTQDIKGEFDENQVAYDFFEDFKLVEGVTKKKGQENKFFDPNRLEFELLGTDKSLIQKYLNDLKSAANQKVLGDIEEKFNSIVRYQLTEIDNEIKDLIDNYHNEIESRKSVLREHLEIAKNLGIDENNFKEYQKSPLNLNIPLNLTIPPNLTIDVFDNTTESEHKKSSPYEHSKLDSSSKLKFNNHNIPIWYLYGAKAISKELDILNNRIIGDNPTYQEIKKLEKIRNRLTLLEFAKVNLETTTTVKSPNFGKPVKSNRPLIIAIAGILGVLVGLVSIFILRQKKALS